MWPTVIAVVAYVLLAIASAAARGRETCPAEAKAAAEQYPRPNDIELAILGRCVPADVPAAVYLATVYDLPDGTLVLIYGGDVDLWDRWMIRRALEISQPGRRLEWVYVEPPPVEEGPPPEMLE
jgi:hypothetical protein